jgi:hypothetical protein
MSYYSAVHGRSFISEVDTYSVALVERSNDEFAVFTEYKYAPARSGRPTIRQGSKMTFEAAVIVYNGLVEQKLKPSDGTRQYIPADRFMMTDVVIMSDEDAQAIHDRYRKTAPTQESVINLEDPTLVDCLEDDMWVGVLFNNNESTLAKIGQNVFLDEIALESNHPFYRDAHEIGGEFRFAGYRTTPSEDRPSSFCAFDMRGDAYKSYDYGTRIQTMANYITAAETKMIELAQFVVGKDNKLSALDKIGKTFTHIRFMRMDKTFKDGTVRLFPS